MKVKEVAKQYNEAENNAEKGNIVHSFIESLFEELASYKSIRISSVMAKVREVDNKWRAFCNRTDQPAEDYFKHIIIKTDPRLAFNMGWINFSKLQELKDAEAERVEREQESKSKRKTVS